MDWNFAQQGAFHRFVEEFDGEVRTVDGEQALANPVEGSRALPGVSEHLGRAGDPPLCVLLTPKQACGDAGQHQRGQRVKGFLGRLSCGREHRS